MPTDLSQALELLARAHFVIDSLYGEQKTQSSQDLADEIHDFVVNLHSDEEEG